MKTFKVGDKVKIDDISAPQIHNKIGVICKYEDIWDMFKIKIYGEAETYFVQSYYLEKIDDEEELTRKCLFENADVLDNCKVTMDSNGISIKSDSGYSITYKTDVGTTTSGCKHYVTTEGLDNYFNKMLEREENKMKEIKNQKVVDLYFKRKEKILADEFKATNKAIVDADKNKIFILGIKQQLDTYIEENEIETKVVYPELPVTEETHNKLNETCNDYHKKLDELKNLKEEVLALLSGCDTYEQEMEILQTYKIVNYNTHYVSMGKVAEETN